MGANDQKTEIAVELGYTEDMFLHSWRPAVGIDCRNECVVYKEETVSASCDLVLILLSITSSKKLLGPVASVS